MCIHVCAGACRIWLVYSACSVAGTKDMTPRAFKQYVRNSVVYTWAHTHVHTPPSNRWKNVASMKEAPQNGRAARHSAAHLGVVLLLRPSEQFICWLTLHWSVLISLMLASARRDGLLTQCNSYISKWFLFSEAAKGVKTKTTNTKKKLANARQNVSIQWVHAAFMVVAHIAVEHLEFV